MPQRPAAKKAPHTQHPLVLVFLTLALGVLLAQAAFWGVTYLSSRPPPYPQIQLEAEGQGSYWHADLQRSFTLVYTDHVPITLTLSPSAPFSTTFRLWEDGHLTRNPRPTLQATPGADHWEVRELPVGANLLVVETPPGRYAAAPIWYLDRSERRTMAHITRTAVFTVTPDRIDVIYRAEYGPGAPQDDWYDLITGDIPPGLFLKRVFYATNQTFTSQNLTSIRTHSPTFEDGWRAVEIYAASDQAFYNPERLPILINVSPAEDDERTTVRVVADEGAHLRFSDPPPDYAHGETWTWSITQHTPPIDLECEFGGAIDPTRSPIAWGRHQLIQLARAVWGWRTRYGAFGWYIVFALPWIIPWLYGGLASAPLIYLRVTRQDAHVQRLTTAGLGLAFTVAWAATTAQGLAHVMQGMSTSGLMWAGALGGLIVLALLQLNMPPAWRWTLTFASPLLVGGLLTATTRAGMWTSGLFTALLGAPFPAFVIWLGLRSWTEWEPNRRFKPARWALALLVILLLLLALPTARRPESFSPIAGAWNLNPGRELALLSNWIGLPYATLLLLLALLRQGGGPRVSQEDVERANTAPSLKDAVSALQTAEETATPISNLKLGALLFAAFAVGLMRRPLTTFAVLVPIAPLMAWVGFRLLTQRPEAHDRPYPLRVLLAAPRRRREIIQAALNLPADRKEGEEEENGPTVEESLRPLTERSQRRISPTEIAFAWGGGRSAWERGVRATLRALALVVPLGIIFATTLANEIATRATTAFGPLEALFVFIGPFALRWLLYAFTLGYFFPQLRGNNGWEKGLYLGLVVGVANLTQDTILYAHSLVDVKGLLVEAGATVLMLCIIGIWAFDWPRLAEAGARLPTLRSLYGLSTVTSYLVSMLPPVTTIVVETTQGRLDSLVRAFVEMILPPVTRL